MKKKLSLLISIICILIGMIDIYAKESVLVEKRNLDNNMIEIALKIDESLEILGGNFVFSYNKDKMKIENIHIVNEEHYMLVVNDKYQGEKIKLSFASDQVVKGTIMVITFKYTDETIKDGDFVVDEVFATNQNNEIVNTITAETLPIITSKGETFIDDSLISFKENSEDEKSEEKDKNPIKKEKSNVTKENKKLTTNNYGYIGIGIFLIIIIGIILRRKTAKK